MYKKQINGNSIHKIRQKLRKKSFFHIIRGRDIAPFDQRVATQSDADSEYRKRVRIGANLKFFVLRMRQLSLNVNYLGHLEDSKIFKRIVLVTK